MTLQREQSLALLCISHDLEFLADFAPEIAVMRNGVIVEQGATVRRYIPQQLLRQDAGQARRMSMLRFVLRRLAHGALITLGDADRVLAVPAGLFDEPPLRLGGTYEGLAEGCTHRLHLDLDVPGVTQGIEHLVHMRRPHSPDHHLMRLRIVLQTHRDVLSDQPLQRENPSFSSSVREMAWTATGSKGSGSSQGSTSAGRALPDSVSVVSAAASLDTRTEDDRRWRTASPGRHRQAGLTAARLVRRRCHDRHDR